MNKDLLEYFNNDELAASVWLDKYAMEGEVTPTDMHRRLAKQFAGAEKAYTNAIDEETIFELLKDFKYIIPQGSVMFGLGNTKVNASLSNCVVIDSPHDSYAGIMKTDEELVQLMKRRCGVGVDISTLRPKNYVVNNAAKTSTGAVSFMDRFSNTTREVAQGARRGALMISMQDSHPDILDFIKAKDDLTKVTGANISVQISDEFMEAVEADSYWETSFDGEVDNSYSAKDVWNRLITQAHKRAEPGLMFSTKQHEYSTSSYYPGYENISSNPCSEIMMGAYDTCRLIAVNMFSYVNNPFTEDAEFDFVKWADHIYIAQKLNDDLVDLEIKAVDRIIDAIMKSKDPQELKLREVKLWNELKRNGRNGRRTGLGFTGLGDTLAALGLPYGGDASNDMVYDIMKAKMIAEFRSSVDMAKDRGQFKGFDGEIEKKSDFIKFLKMIDPNLYHRMMRHGRRNISISTVAPTGSLSLLAGTTSGIEPMFQPYYTRRRKINPNDEGKVVAFTDKTGDTWEEFTVIHPKFKEWYNSNSQNLWNDKDGNIKQLEECSEHDLNISFKESPWYQSTANDVDWKDRIEIQSVIQQFTTHSISSTINLPKETTAEEVGNIYMEAWKKGVKGITVYVDGSRDGVLITKTEKADKFTYNDAPSRPKSLTCDIHLTKYRGKEFVAFVGLYDDNPYEVFALENVWKIKPGTGNLVKKGNGRYDVTVNDNGTIEDITKDMTHEEEAITRLLSWGLRHGGDITYGVEQLRKSKGDITSFGKAVARVLNKYVKERGGTKCPQCEADLVLEEGCAHCNSCGYSRC